MKKTIVVFSNPFGYGPTANAIPVIENLLTAVKEIDIIFAGSRLCREIIDNDQIKIVDIDERSRDQIKFFLKTLDNPHIISFQNRFAIKAAKALNLRSAFLDILAWFWNEIPQEHLLADIIFWIRFPGIEKKMPLSRKIYVVSGIITVLPNLKKKNQLMIHIGGAKYPFSNNAPTNYLNLLADALNGFSCKNIYKSTLFIGGSEAIEYIKQKSINRDIIFASLSQKEFIKELSQSVHVFTTAGLSSTLESFSQKIPVSFLLPINLTQFVLINMLKRYNACPQYMGWNNYVKVKNNLTKMTEKDAINEFNDYAKKISLNLNIKQKFTRDFIRKANTIPNNTNQNSLVDYIGNTGAKEIAKILIKEWKI
ncbi:MAG: hypothetical protein V1732_06290 [Patescibacteria group bacterium]